jgi:hypothetical protein
MVPELPWADRDAIVQGHAGVYSSFLLHARTAGSGSECLPICCFGKRGGAASSEVRRTCLSTSPWN